MIDWISIVRHSRRRFSGFAGARSPVRIPGRPRKKHKIASVTPLTTSTSSIDNCRLTDSPTISHRSRSSNKQTNKRDFKTTPCCSSPYCINNQPIKVVDTDENLVKKEQQQQQQQQFTDATSTIEQQQPNNGRQTSSGNTDVNINNENDVSM